ncbi:MAG: DnaJ domain-containing protein [Alphaproteobacteria bacterium]
MFPYVILGIALLIGVILIGRWFLSADPKKMASTVRWAAAILAAGLGLYLVAAGRWSWIPMILFVLLPWLTRLRALANLAKSARGPSPGQTSDVETQYLRMTLNHDTGAMSGIVLRGAFEGRELGDLSLEELLSLLEECRAGDQQSAAVLETYLERAHGSEWREGAAAAGPAGFGGGAMTRAEAREVLGVKPGASEAAIKEAHRKLMSKIHPDHGGSTYIAAKINQAKDVLLGG